MKDFPAGNHPSLRDFWYVCHDLEDSVHPERARQDCPAMPRAGGYSPTIWRARLRAMSIWLQMFS